MSKPRLYPLLSVVLLLAAMILPVRAAQAASATVTVSAVVAHHARIQLDQPSVISVSAEDIARGYVDVERSVQVLVRSNAHDGYTLAFDCECHSIRQAQVQGVAGGLQVGAATAYAVRPAAGPGMWVDRVNLRFRFLLADDARPGTHAWPIRISLMTA
jgi:hypothetical protein